MAASISPPSVGSVCREDGAVSESVPLVVATSFPLVRVCVEYDPSVSVGIGEELVVTEEPSGVLGLAEGDDAVSCASRALIVDDVISMPFLVVETFACSTLLAVDSDIAISVVL